MSPLMIGITIFVSLLIVFSLALTIIKQVRNAPDEVQRPVRGGIPVVATITAVHVQQDWKEEERWERSSWTGNLERQKTWQTCYDVTAQGRHSQTEQRYTFRSKVWSDDVAKMPTVGDTLLVVVDLHHPQR